MMMLKEVLTNVYFEKIKNIIYYNLGIHLAKSKKLMVSGRLQSLLIKCGVKNFKDYLTYVTNDKTGHALSELVEKITTNHTYFYREADHFNYLTQIVLTELIVASQKNNYDKIRIWVAGCSTGEEAYSVAMVIEEYLLEQNIQIDFSILATDISNRVIAKAKLGDYISEKLSELPLKYKMRYFEIISGNIYRVKTKIKEKILFKLLNLNRESFPFSNKFDIIFCRNVMIYFDDVSRESLIKKFFKNTKADGYLFIGHAESLPRKICPYNYIRPAIYKKIEN